MLAEVERACPWRAVRSLGAIQPQNEWLDDGALTDAGKAPIEQLFRNLEAKSHACVPWEEAKLRLMAPFKR